MTKHIELYLRHYLMERDILYDQDEHTMTFGEHTLKVDTSYYEEEWYYGELYVGGLSILVKVPIAEALKESQDTLAKVKNLFGGIRGLGMINDFKPDGDSVWLDINDVHVPKRILCGIYNEVVIKTWNAGIPLYKEIEKHNGNTSRWTKEKLADEILRLARVSDEYPFYPANSFYENDEENSIEWEDNGICGSICFDGEYYDDIYDAPKAALRSLLESFRNDIWEKAEYVYPCPKNLDTDDWFFKSKSSPDEKVFDTVLEHINSSNAIQLAKYANTALGLLSCGKEIMKVGDYEFQRQADGTFVTTVEDQIGTITLPIEQIGTKNEVLKLCEDIVRLYWKSDKNS